MEIIRKLVKLPKLEYYEMHLSLINCLLPSKMTPMEIKVMASFMSLEGDIAVYRFGPSARRVVMKLLGVSSQGLSNYIGHMAKKGFLLQAGDMVNILPLLLPDVKYQVYMFKLINTDE